MAFTLAFAGKGGTGKTTLAALTVRTLVSSGASRVLAVDADPNAMLHEGLGVSVERSVGEITEDVIATETRASDMPKEMWLEYEIHRYLVEERGYDLLSLGRPEGAGCYCYANNLVRSCIDRLERGYDFLVMDNEAGFEHMSRRTTRNVDMLVLVSDASVRGLRTAGRISRLADELGIGVGSRHLVVNRCTPPLDEALLAEAAHEGLPLLGVIPEDPAIIRAELESVSLLEIPDDSPAVKAIREVIGVLVPVVAGNADPARSAEPG